ncbi:response regulator [Halohasta litorea]|uniref:histidine kinase n=1 Tax=Halohasta litorea TaxID=869891 RepID=A0ABD6D9E7_9EURY|nr:response regulator [Halohasta litorea]
MMNSILDGPARSEPIRVLHVDDEPDFGDLVALYLERIDPVLQVTTVTNVEDAWTHLEENTVDCLVSDYEMPETDGIELLRDVREEYPNLPYILFTGQGSEKVASEAISAGVTDYLQKSGNREVYELLANRITQAVGHSQSERYATLAREQLQSLFDQIDGFYAVDGEWTVTYWNEQMADRTGSTPEDVIGEPLWEVHPTISETGVEDALRSVSETGETVETEAYLEAADRWVTIRAHPVGDNVFVHSTDVTGDKRRVQELTRRNQRLESVARTLSHDLKTPLNVAEGRLELAEETGELTHLETVASAHNRMQNLINELLRMARQEEFEKTTVELTELLTEAWAFAETGDAELRIDVAETASLRADESQLQRIFENLFENAVEHGDAERITVGSGMSETALYVADDGSGLPEITKDMFESGVTTADEGTGYGLSIVKQIVHEHDWEIESTTAASGGVRFNIKGIESLQSASVDAVSTKHTG